MLNDSHREDGRDGAEKPHASASPQTSRPPGLAPAPRDARALTAAHILSLQRTVGNRATVALLQRATLARTKAPRSAFRGTAGDADVFAVQAGAEAAGLAPISVTLDYADKQREVKEGQIADFLAADMPGIYKDKRELWPYQKLDELRQEYVRDASRIALAEAAYNEFVVPASVANKSAASFRAVQYQLGYDDDNVAPDEGLSDSDKSTMAQRLDEADLVELNATVVQNQQLVASTQGGMLATIYEIQAAMQRRAATLAHDAERAAEKEKKAIEAKIKAVSHAADLIGEALEAASFLGFAGRTALHEIAEGGAGAFKGGLEVGGKAGALESPIEAVVSEGYKDELEQVEVKIDQAVLAAASAEQLDSELSLAGAAVRLRSSLQQLDANTSGLAQALRKRKKFFGDLGAGTERARGETQGSGASQYLVYVSQANETNTYIELAQASAASGLKVMDNSIDGMAAHRREHFAVDYEGMMVHAARLVDDDGPDLQQLQSARSDMRKFADAADAQLRVIREVMKSLPQAEDPPSRSRARS